MKPDTLTHTPQPLDAPIAQWTPTLAHRVGTHLRALLDSYSEVLFLRGWMLGLGILLVTLLAPNVAMAGMVAVIAAYAFARFIGVGSAFLESGFYTYNPLLVGLSIGHLFLLTPLTLFFVITAGITAFLLTHGLFSASWYYLRLPVLSLPFVLVTSIAYLAAGTYTNLYVGALYPQPIAAFDSALPLWMAGFFRALGAVFFVPSVLTGALLAVLLLLRSRILFLLAVAGYYAGVFTLAMLGGATEAIFLNPNAFNFILIAMALGGVFLIPSPSSYLIALIAVIISTVVLTASEVFWSRWGIPVLAFPFNMVTLGFLYTLKVVEFPLLTQTLGSPEEVLDEHQAGSQRYPGSLRSLGLPFAGKWTVWQAFNGSWTHQGAWRFAYDFVITDPAGATFRNEGLRLEDYFAFRKPVLSPVRGRVVRTVDGLPDQPIGVTDRAHNWGNLVIIEDERGFFVEISHFAQSSIQVQEGEWVERGALLGLCGNSGYSPQPHIHLQVQESAQIGAPTLPFSFVSYRSEDGAYHANDIPALGSRVESLPAERGLEVRMAFVLDERYRYQIRGEAPAGLGRRTPDEVEWVVRMAPDSTFFLDSGHGKLYFGIHDGTFYIYRLEGDDPTLRALFLALPRLPLAYRKGMTWTDHVPAGVLIHGIKRAVVRLVQSIVPGAGKVHIRLEFVDERRIEGRVDSGLLATPIRTCVVLDQFRALESFSVGSLILERMPDPTPRVRSTGQPCTSSF